MLFNELYKLNNTEVNHLVNKEIELRKEWHQAKIDREKEELENSIKIKDNKHLFIGKSAAEQSYIKFTLSECIYANKCEKLRFKTWEAERDAESLGKVLLYNKNADYDLKHGYNEGYKLGLKESNSEYKVSEELLSIMLERNKRFIEGYKDGLNRLFERK